MKRYTILNEYYIRDEYTSRKLNQKESLKQLNLQEKIIHEKTLLIKKLLKTLNYMEKQQK